MPVALAADTLSSRRRRGVWKHPSVTVDSKRLGERVAAAAAVAAAATTMEWPSYRRTLVRSRGRLGGWSCDCWQREAPRRPVQPPGSRDNPAAVVVAAVVAAAQLRRPPRVCALLLRRGPWPIRRYALQIMATMTAMQQQQTWIETGRPRPKLPSYQCHCQPEEQEDTKEVAAAAETTKASLTLISALRMILMLMLMLHNILVLRHPKVRPVLLRRPVVVVECPRRPGRRSALPKRKIDRHRHGAARRSLAALLSTLRD